MCYVCNCFEWTLDLIQRGVTFCLTCWLACAVCFGFLIATMAGIAYGYNYSLAEFITLSRSDVSIYMRRGQFYDKPDMFHPKRRMEDEEDEFSNLSGDYQETQSSDNPALLDKWKKNQDMRNYAEKLAKYSESRRNFVDYEQVESEPSPYSESQTNLNHYGQSEMSEESIPKPKSTNELPSRLSTTKQDSTNTRRMFEPISLISNANTEESDNVDKDDELHKILDKINSKHNVDAEKKAVSPDIRILFEDEPKSTNLKMNRFWKNLIPKVTEYTTNVDEDMVYKSI